MSKLVTLSRLLCLTTALAAGPALMATSDIAYAKEFGQHGGGRHQQGNSRPANLTKRNGISPHFVISGQPANVKKVLPHRKEKSREPGCKTNCPKPMQTTTKGNSTQPTTDGNTVATANPKSTNGTATISNGVTTSAIFNGNGLTVSSTSPGRITVTNGSNSSVTLAGGSLTLSGATSVKAGPGVDVVRLPNGTVSIAIKPASATLSPPTKGGDPSAIPVIVETAKGVETFYRTLGTIPAAVGLGGLIATSPAAQASGTIEHRDPVTGPLRQTIETAGELATDVGNEISSWW